MTNVIDLPVITNLDIPPDRVLTGALGAEMQSAIVIGWDKDGQFYFASSDADGGAVLWLIEKAKQKLLEPS